MAVERATPISLNDLYQTIDIEGVTPVVKPLTRYPGVHILKRMGNSKDPECAVGIMRTFYSKHPDFGLEATFFVITRALQAE